MATLLKYLSSTRPVIVAKSIKSTCGSQFGVPKLFIYQFKHPFSFRNLTTQTKQMSKSPWEVDTNVSKDVVLYNHDNTKFHRTLNIFAIAQFFFWTYSAQFAFSTLRDIPVADVKQNQEDLPWYRKINLGSNKFKNGIAVLCLSVGTLILGCSWMYALKAVQTVVLRKGGKNVTFITHGPFNKLRYLDLPLSSVSATQSRAGAPVNLPIKVKGFVGYFLIDMRGKFYNTALFDATVGLKRLLK